jgi:hypothetical protein
VYVTNAVTLKGFCMTTLTTEEIIELARQAGMVVVNDKFSLLPFLEAFAKLVASAATAKEREACAKVCDELSKKHSWEGCYANECAEEIRARGQHE